MRATINFDTLEYMDELRQSGMDEKQAQAITKANAKAFAQMIELKELATKGDLKLMEVALKKDMQEMKVELTKYINDSMWKTIGILATFQTIMFGVIQYFGK